jgi:hypothetical protein
MVYKQVLSLQYLQAVAVALCLEGARLPAAAKAGPFALFVIPKERKGCRHGPGSPTSADFALGGVEGDRLSGTKGPAFSNRVRSISARATDPLLLIVKDHFVVP